MGRCIFGKYYGHKIHTSRKYICSWDIDLHGWHSKYHLQDRMCMKFEVSILVLLFNEGISIDARTNYLHV